MRKRSKRIEISPGEGDREEIFWSAVGLSARGLGASPFTGAQMTWPLCA